jgi:hypothetical protein
MQEPTKQAALQALGGSIGCCDWQPQLTAKEREQW